MDLTPREIKALEIAEKFRIIQNGNVWTVPSQYGAGRYSVSMVGKSGDCTCPDFELRREPCKHMLAVRYVIASERNADGTSTINETFEVTKRTTYPQDWRAYNEAQTNEGDVFQALLSELCMSIQEPIQIKGRPRIPLCDSVFAATMKVYSTVSGRRFMSDLRESKERGFIGTLPHFNTVLNALEKPELTPILRGLITQSSLPLTAVETDFAVDSSGFSTCKFERWFDHKWGKERLRHEWVKVHIMCGVKTNVVTAVEIKEKNTNDTEMLQPLLNRTHEHFEIAEVSGDKAYLSYNNVRAIAKINAAPFIAFKKNSGPGDFRKEGVATTCVVERDVLLLHVSPG